MKHSVPSAPFHSLPAHGNGATGGGGLSPRVFSGQSSGQFFGPRAVDVFEIARTFPDRWARFMAEVYRCDIALIMTVFSVSDRTARNWCQAKGGVRSQHLIAAQTQHPAEYAEIVLLEAA